MKKFDLRRALGGGAIQSEQERTLGVQVRGEINSYYECNEESHKRGNFINNAILRVAQEDEMKNVILSESEFADGRRKTSPDSLISPRPLWERVRVRGHVNSEKTFSKELSCNNSSYIEINKNLDCFGSKEPHNDATNSLAPCGRGQGEGSKVAFTLAEVLITIAIIGVVAAITLPTLIEKHREQVTVNKVKKFYSNINQAYIMAKEDNDSILNWVDTSNGYDNIAAGKTVIETIMPYMKILKYCGNGKSCDVNTATYLLNGEYWGNYSAGRGYYKLILADGAVMWLRTSFADTGYCKNNDGGYKNVCGVIWYDVNGKQAPNTVGRDIFLFMMLENGIMPDKDSTCVLDKAGWGCTSYILQNGNMDYLHKNGK